jgi:hypothetical protein
MTPEILAVSSAKLGAPSDEEDPVSDSAVLLDTLKRDLRAE